MSEQQKTPALFDVSGTTGRERHDLSASQLMLGSSGSCAIVLSNVPPRAAVVEQNANGCRVAALVSGVVSIDGAAIDAGAERAVDVGSTIEIGSHKLRLVAASEVLSFRPDVQVRRADLEEARAAKRSGLIVGAAMALTVAGFFLFLKDDKAAADKQRRAEIKKAQQSEAVIEALIARGDELFLHGKYAGVCSGDNCAAPETCVSAEECFQRVVGIQASDAYAVGRLKEIQAISGSDNPETNQLRNEQIRQLLSRADRLYGNGAWTKPPEANARDLYLQVLTLDPQNEVARTRIEEIRARGADDAESVATLLANAQEYILKDAYVSPPGANAFELLQKVLAIEPENEKALAAVFDMAAYSLYQGNVARRVADSSAMTRWYDTAAVLGVDPAYLKPLREGAELMRESKSTTIIVSGPPLEPSEKSKKNAAGYLHAADLERRVKQFELESKSSSGSVPSRRFIEVPQG